MIVLDCQAGDVECGNARHLVLEVAHCDEVSRQERLDALHRLMTGISTSSADCLVRRRVRFGKICKLLTILYFYVRALLGALLRQAGGKARVTEVLTSAVLELEFLQSPIVKLLVPILPFHLAQ